MSLQSECRFLLVDDHAVVREGIAFLLQAEENMSVVAQAASCKEGLEAIEKYRPNLVVTDLSLPDRNGLELIRDALAVYPETLFLVVSMHDEALYAERVLRAGAKGYIMKEAASDELVEAVRQITRGEIYVSPKMANLLLRRLSNNQGKLPEENSVLQILSDRELQVFELVGKAFSNQDIAEKLNISARTVDAHKTKIKTKLEISDNNALLRFAVQWLNLEDI
ncbi:MAG: response regulator transcription factor [Verrucomicrobiales bacterium]|nr:response regulator transcription factor [Verrucomicrobiales bacterium]